MNEDMVYGFCCHGAGLALYSAASEKTRDSIRNLWKRGRITSRIRRIGDWNLITFHAT